MLNWMWLGAFVLVLLPAGQSGERSAAAVSPQTFVGTWVGTQSWNVATPPPGASENQPVSLTIEMLNGQLTGKLTPFMGGDDGATFVVAQIVGDELQASASFGRPAPVAAPAGAPAKPAIVDEEEGSSRVVPTTRAKRPTWKDTVKIQLAFTADRLDLKGTADVTMNDVKWLRFNYDLSRKRARY